MKIEKRPEWTKKLWDLSLPWDRQPLVIWATESADTKALVQRVYLETGVPASRRTVSRELTWARRKGLRIPSFRLLYGTAGKEAETVQHTIVEGPSGEELALEKKLATARGTLEQERKRVSVLQKELHKAQEALDFRQSAKGFEREIVIKPTSGLKRSLRSGTPVVMASDWHVEEVVDLFRVNGVNEYNPEIAQQRAEKFFQGATYKIAQASREYDCENVILWAGGDFITGHIHESYLQSNAMAPAQAVRFWKSMFRDGIEMMLEELPQVKRLCVVCNYGNHGRTTAKPVDGSVGAANSFEYAAYLDLEEYFQAKKEERVEFKISAGTLEYVQLYEWVVRFTHGDKGVKFRDAIGGISTAARKAVMGWDTSRYADYTVMGHWHQWTTPFNDIVVNGSLIGYNPFAMDIKARWEPAQQGFWVLDEERGRRHTESIWVSPYGARKPVQ